MNNLATIQAILKTTGQYEEFLKELTEEEFQLTPATGVWSYSEVYSHIFQANMVSLIALERCVRGNKPLIGTPNWLGRVVLFIGYFPPFKIKAPLEIAQLATKTSMEDARNYIIRFKEKLTEVGPQCRKALTSHTAKHPRLGMLNAPQWLRFIQIHSTHHLKQLKRIQKLLIIN